MNLTDTGPKRPRLHLPKALLAAGLSERRSPTLSSLEWRNIVTELLG